MKKFSTFICLLIMVCIFGGMAYAQDTTPPSEVDTVVVDPNGNGTMIDLDWTGYDESVDGDIKHYRIYQSLSNFSDVSDVTLLDTVNAGNFSYSVQNLERDTTYWFAIVAVDLMDNADDQVTAVFGTPIDTVPPQEATGLKAHSVDDTVTFSWNHSINSYYDLAGYRAYFADDTQGVFLPSDQNSYTAGDLDPAAGYPFRVTAVDNDGNESSGVTVTGITLLDNPAITKVSPRSGGVKLYWAAGNLSEYVKQYCVYVSESEFSSVEGLTPRNTTTSLSVAVTGLASGVSYYFAVTVVNISDGEQKSVNTVSATPITGTNVSGEITKNTNWTMAGGPYIVTGDITIRNAGHSNNSNPVAATLTIEPGVQIRFEPGTGLYVGKTYNHSSYSYFGALAVQGTSELPVIFTSNKTSPVPGDWKGIYFRDETLDSKSVLEHGVVEYGGHTHSANLYFTSASPTVKNSAIRFSSFDGLYLNSASPTISSNSITDNSNHGISSNGSSAGWITDNNFAGNGEAPINIHPNGVNRVSGTSGTGNGQNYIRVYAGEITANATWVKQPLLYVITGDITIRNAGHSNNNNPVAATLTIEPGVEIRFEPGTGLYVGKTYNHSSYSYFGALAVQGTSELPVIFTSNKTSPVPGDWKGIYFRDETLDSKSVLEHGVVEYGGHTHSANLYFTSASPTIRNNTVRYSSSNGVYVEDSAAPLIYSNYFYGNSGSAINVSPNRVKGTSGNSDPVNEQSYIGVRGGDLTSNSTWVNQGLPYVILGDVTIRNAGHSNNSNPVAATLTIEPGVQIRFEPGTGLYVGKTYNHSSYSYFGALAVQGTSELPVIFTSNKTSPVPGDWKGIYFRDETLDSKSVLEHGVVEYGGHTHSANLYFTSASPTVKNSAIRFSSFDGLYLNSASPTISSNSITDNSNHGISSNGSSAGWITDNNFAGNGEAPINIHPNGVKRVSGTSGTGNGQNYIRVYAGEITANATWVKQPLLYVITGDITIRNTGHSNNSNPVAATLTIEPGVQIRFEPGTGLYVGKTYNHSSYSYFGALAVQGTSELPVIFTSNEASPVPGDWKGIYFRDETLDSKSVLEHGVVEYGGHTHSANLYFTSASPTIRNNTVRYSSSNGVYVEDSAAPLLDSNYFYGNSGPAINVSPNRVKRTSGNSDPVNERSYIGVRGGDLTSNSTWVNQGLPYVILGDVTIRNAGHSNNSIPVAATLSIEPGVQIRFEPGTGLYVGKTYNHSSYSYFGALAVQGTSELPVIFTSNKTSPVPGDWKGIYFRTETLDFKSLLEHCIVEYGGYTNNANIYLANAKPTIQYNTIRNSTHSGIRISGTGSNNVAISCNNFKDNFYGVYTSGDARPLIHNNNFLRNLTAGVHNAGSVTVDAKSNWWGDANGANYNGDDVSSKVDFNPWLVAESDCIGTPPTNTAPFTPRNPVPGYGAVRVPVIAEGQLIAVILGWAGGDPNPWDTVVYDLYFGTAKDSLVNVAEGIETASYDKAGLKEGTTYYWKIVARDDVSAETAGPVWQFTTLGPPPDLFVSDIARQPAADLQAGQTITFTATIENAGSGPVVDGFNVELYVNGSSIGSKTVNPVMAENTSLTLSFAWTAVAGSHYVEVRVDSQNNVVELYEENNSRTVDLPYVKDPTPPDLLSTLPAHGVSLKQADAIIFTLKDQYGEVDDTAVIASIVVLNGDNQPVGGIASEVSDRFTFTPNRIPLADDTYSVSLTARDLEGNTKDYNFSFSVDGQPPAEPTITGGAVLSGLIQVRPVQNKSRTATIVLTGIREDNTAVYINNQEKISTGSGNWSASLSLAQGDNALEIWLQDVAGNRSPSVWVEILVDSVAPVISGITPVDKSFINTAPPAVAVTFSEATGGLNLSESSLSVKDLNQQPLDGSWSLVGSNQLVFTPTAGWADSNYTVNLQLADQLGNRSIAKTYHFTLDTTPPPAPAINPESTLTHIPIQQISGTKEAYAALLLNGAQIGGNTLQTVWTHTATLVPGSNSFIFGARDRAGNQSEADPITIVFDDVPPPAVGTLQLNTAGDGRAINLDWTGYNEAVHGDVAGYRIYRSTAAFTDVSAANLIDTVGAGKYKYTAVDLIRAKTYWFAAVAVDVQGNASQDASPISGTAKDVVPPENVSNLAAQSFTDRLVFTWTHSADSHGDLAGYRVVFKADGTNEIISDEVISTALSSIEKTKLAPAGGYQLYVYAVDNDDNQSSGITVIGVTLLANPGNLTAEVHSGYVDLNWNGVVPSQYVKHYAVYASESDFSSVAGMTPTLTSNQIDAHTSNKYGAKVAGLTNNVTYYFAVTTVNNSGGELQTVTTITAKPEPDSLGPEISSVKVDEQLLAEGSTLTKPVTFSCQAQDPVGVSRVEFSIDGSLVRTDYSAAYTVFWNVVEVEDAAHTLTIDAYDTLGNLTTENFSLNVALATPAAPQITEPAAGIITNKPTVTVSGQAGKFSEVSLYNNGTETGVVIALDGLGNFSTPLTLAEGENRLQAAAGNRAGEGPKTAAVLVILDTSLPVSPSDLAAQVRTDGAVRLTWKAPVATEVAGYNLYRASSRFATPQGSGKINTNLIRTTSFDDLPPSDGTWYYRVSTLDAAGNESDLSTEAVARADGTAPRALAIDYSPQGAVDAQTGTMAPGTVNLVLTVNEPLQSDPYLSIAPDGGIPIAVQLSKDADTIYSGFFVISDNTPSGTAYAIFSARDTVGNRGTEIDAGSTVQIDTDGPTVTRLVLNPPSPIKNDQQSPVAVTVVFGLDEKIKPTEFPQLSCLLSGDQREPIELDSMAELVPQAGDVQTWQAQFKLPADGGLTDAETFYFIYQGRDALGNASDRIQAQNLFQVYQGDLPPLAPPLEFKAISLPGGKIRLTWLALEKAVGYQLYRKAPGESELTAYARLDAVEVFEDLPPEDGSYAYAIASIRRENTQEALSGLSDPVVVNSDAVGPGAPLNLTLELVANGIKAEWDPPPYTEDITYSIYRDTKEITTTDGLAPLVSGIAQTLVVDPTPSLTAHWYAITAVDAVGNESAPSNADYLNVQLLPVSGIRVVQADNQPPAVTWTHPGGDIAGYDIYLGPGDASVKLNPTLLTVKGYTDTGYSGDERRYTIVTVDNNHVESLGRSLTLPVLQAALRDGSRIRRGIMNRLDYVVRNEGAGRVDNIQLKVKLESHDHTSEPFSLDPGTSRTIPVIVGGYDDLAEGLAALTTTIEVIPRTNEKVQIVRSDQIEVTDGMLRLQILNEEFTRAVSGKVQFTIENTGEAEIEIVTAKNSGKSASDQITFYLLDEDGNILTTRAFKQVTGDKLVTLSNKNTVARIAAGGTFTSDLISMPVPANAPDHVILRQDIDHVYYHQGQATQVKMDGLSTTHAVNLVDTAYYGKLLDITPQSSTGDRDIVITGQAVERAGGEPMAHVPLTLVITLDGFERSYEVFTGDYGAFTHSFKPLAGESGIYRVRAVHPDRTDKPVHGQFVINKVAVTPAILNLKAPKNYTNTIQIRVRPGDGTTVNNLRLEYDAADQPTGEKPAGIHLTPGQPIAQLDGNKTAYLPFTIWADNTADQTDKVVLKVISVESAPDVWGSVTINTYFSQAKPVLSFTPNHVETGVAREHTVTETVTLKNNGLADMHDVQLSLLIPDDTGAPNWVYLSTTTAIKNLAIGSTQQVGVTFAPTHAVAEGDYAFKLRVEASNHATTDINLYAAVTQSGAGNILFKLSDIYTGTIDKNGDVVQGLPGARIKLQNDEALSIEYNQNSDSFGEVYFENIPAGPYKCRITANNHQEYIGRVWIKPGVTVNEDVFLDYNLVTVEWQVNEITIEDKYEIVLSATYETNVPAAVVVVEPSSVTLPKMKAGDVFNGEFTLTNHGLIRADNLDLTIPTDDQYFKYEFLAGLPSSLAAKERITVPYRVTSIKSLEPDEDGQATGGGCSTYRTCVVVGYRYECANGQWTKGAVNYCYTRTYGSCGGGGGVISTAGGGGTWSVGGSSGSGTVSKPAPKPKTVEGVECFPKPPRKERFCLPCWFKDTFGNMNQNTGSSVNLVMREYYRDHVDLSVKAPGGMIEAKRWFYGNQWLWEHDRNRLDFQPAAIGGGIESIDKGGVVYEKSSIDADIFVHDIFRIVKTDTGYRWEDPKGGWIDYDSNGNVAAQGSRTGVRAKLLYQDGKLSGVADRNNNQVLWYETADDGLITAVYDAEDRRVEYDYSDGRLSQVKDVLGYETNFEYDSQGRLEKIIEPAGRIITVSYDKYNGVASVLDSQSEGFFFEYEFDEATQEQYARIETSAGKIKEVWYDRDFETRRVAINGRTVEKIAKDGRNLLVTDEQGNVTRKNYDEWDNLIQVIYPDGSSVSYKYEHKYNKQIEAIDENDGVTRYAYDNIGNLIKKTEAAGSDYERITEYTYDDDGNLLTTLRLADANTMEALTRLSYDLQGNLTSITDPQGGITRFTSHDAMGNVLTKIGVRGKQWYYEYDAAGQLKKVIDPLGNATEFFYDEMGKKVNEVDSNNMAKLYEYDKRNHLIKITDALSNITRFEYNPDGKLVKQIDPEGKAIQYEYDPDGRLLKTTDGNGNQIEMEYGDASTSGCSSCSAAGGTSNQPARITYPTFAKEFIYDKRGRKKIEKYVLSTSETYHANFDYDRAGNLIARTDKEDNIIGYAYDALSRLKTVTDALDQETEYFYDNRDNLTALTDANGNTTWFEYDKNNRLTKEIRPEGQSTAYQYDPAGNLIGKTDAKNQKVEYDYDDAGRLVQIRYFKAEDHVNPTKNVTFNFDGAGNLASYSDGITSATYTYDELNRKLSETTNYGTFEKTSTYTYYRNGIKKTFTGPDGISYAYTYDNNNQLTGVNIPGAGYITYSAYKWNRPTEVILPGGSRKQYEYDPLMRVKSITAKDPAQNILLNYQYDYDRMDNITAKVTEHGEYGYGYDELYRLTNTDNPVQTDEGFSYDAVGNRLTAESVADDWSYNDNNELQGFAGISYEYDANGNMTKKTDAGQVANYIYNAEDRLEGVEDGSGSLISQYNYDPFGRRLWKEVNGVRTYFVYADEGLVAEVDDAGNVTKSYGYRPGSTWTTDPLFMNVGGQYYFYQNDHLGTSQKLIAVNGAVVWSAKYSSFGEADVDPSSSVTNNLRFPGQYYDQETGLNYNLNRYYDPKTMRYLRVDPIGLSSGINLFTYVLNNPINLIDPLGLDDSKVGHLGWLSDSMSATGGVPKGFDPVPINWSESRREFIEWLKSIWSDTGDTCKDAIDSFDPFLVATGRVFIGIGKASEGTWNALVYNQSVYIGTGKAIEGTWDVLVYNEDFHRGTAFGFKTAGKIKLMTTAFVGVKTYAIYDIAAGGPVTTAVVGQHLANPQATYDFVNSMFPGTTPTMNWPGAYGAAVGKLLGTENW